MKKSVAREYLESFLIAVILALFVRTWVFQAFKIPSGSMEPNLLIGDHLIVNKMEFAPTATALERVLLPHREIRRGDDKPGVSNLIDILAVATGRTPGEIEVAYEASGYGDLKGDVGEAVVELLTPVRERYLELRADEPELLRLLALGAEKAREASAPTLAAMYERMGFVRLDQA